eukprot:ctg_5016.g602
MESVAAGLAKVALQIASVGERQAVHQNVQTAPLLSH